jgi:hypothetical protein
MQTHALPGHSASGNVETSVCADSDSAPQLSAAVTSEPTRMRASTASSRPSSSSSGGARYASGWTSPRRGGVPDDGHPASTRSRETSGRQGAQG